MPVGPLCGVVPRGLDHLGEIVTHGVYLSIKLAIGRCAQTVMDEHDAVICCVTIGVIAQRE